MSAGRQAGSPATGSATGRDRPGPRSRRTGWTARRCSGTGSRWMCSMRWSRCRVSSGGTALASTRGQLLGYEEGPIPQLVTLECSPGDVARGIVATEAVMRSGERTRQLLQTALKDLQQRLRTTLKEIEDSPHSG